MSHKSNKKIKEAFDEVFSFSNEEDRVEADAKVLMAQFLSGVQEQADKQGLKRKNLAKRIGTSASYLTQLYRGHKLLNLMTVARLQKALGIAFKVTVKEQESSLANEKEIAEYLDRFYQKNKGEYIKITKNRFLDEHKTNLPEPELPDTGNAEMMTA